MTIVIEDGSIVSGANSYVSEAELEAISDSRGVTLLRDTAELLLESMVSFESLSFVGNKSTKSQPLQWPRSNVYIDGFGYQNTEIPQEVKDGQIATALAINDGFNPSSTVERAMKSDQVGPLKTEWSDSASQTEIIRSISQATQKIVTGSGGINFNVRVG